MKNIAFMRSTDDGATWTVPIYLNRAHGAFGPEMVTDGEGGIYVFWKDERHGLSDLYFNRSKDYGQTWLPADVRLSPGSPGNGVSANPSAVCQPGGQVMLAFSHAPEGKMATIYFRASKDYGSTWGDLVQVNDNLEFHMDFPQLVRGSDGQLAISWNFAGQREFSALYLDASSDGGKTWGQDRIVYSSRPSVMAYLKMRSLAGNRLALFWIDKIQGETCVLYKISKDFGLSWSAESRPDGQLNRNPGTPFSIDLQVESDNRRTVAVAWADFKAGIADVRASFSLDGGATWLADPVQISQGQAIAARHFLPQMAIQGNTVFLIYQRGIKPPGADEENPADLFFRSLTMKKWTPEGDAGNAR